MFPSPEEIRMAAYFRWQRGGWRHGRDGTDWAAAEQDLLFALNYRVLAHYRLDAPEEVRIGDGRRKVCRFCEQSAPRAAFSAPARTIPEALGNTAVLSCDTCDECRASFARGIEAEFAAFARPYLGGPARPPAPGIPIGAFKGLASMALTLLPAQELDFFRDALEWVANPDHAQDGGAFGDLGCYLHHAHSPSGHPWAALARRVEAEAPFPYMLFFLGTPAVTFELPVPLCARDEDLDGDVLVVPRVASPGEPGAADGPCTFVPIATPAVVRRGPLPKAVG